MKANLILGRRPVAGTELGFHLPPNVGSGTLALEVVGPRGETDLGDLNVVVRNPRGDMPLLTRTLSYESKWKLELPAGTYLLVVDEAARTDPYHGSLMRPRAFGRFTSPITIRAGQTESLQARLSKPSYLELHLVGVERPEDREALLDQGWVFDE